MPSKAMRYWSDLDGILLVDWDELCEDYLKKERTEEYTGRFNGNATGSFELEVGGSLADTEHWHRRRKAKPSNRAEMTPACFQEEGGDLALDITHCKMDTGS